MDEPADKKYENNVLFLSKTVLKLFIAFYMAFYWRFEFRGKSIFIRKALKH